MGHCVGFFAFWSLNFLFKTAFRILLYIIMIELGFLLRLGYKLIIIVLRVLCYEIAY